MIAALGVLVLAASVHAAPVTWTLNNVVFSDGAQTATTVTGSFTWDAAKYDEVYLNLGDAVLASEAAMGAFSITTSGYSGSIPFSTGASYNSGTSVFYSSGVFTPNEFIWEPLDPFRPLSASALCPRIDR